MVKAITCYSRDQHDSRISNSPFIDTKVSYILGDLSISYRILNDDNISIEGYAFINARVFADMRILRIKT